MCTVDGVLRFATSLGFNEREQMEHRNMVKLAHPESPERIEMALHRLAEHGLLERCQLLHKFHFCDEGELRQTHSSELVEGVQGVANGRLEQEEVNQWAGRFDSVFATPNTDEAALSAVACCRSMAEWVVTEKIPNGFALVRPPGHHADRDEPCGFCIFNNNAQAAEAAYTAGAERILILDLDVHHGQGTQRIFYDDPRVMYISIHRFENGTYWPYLAESASSAIGEGAGKGFTVNIPLQETGCGDADYLAILFNVILPLGQFWQPSLVIISAGYDCLAGDPLGGMLVSPQCYAHIVHHMKTLANGKLLMILEGGYNHRVLADGVAASVRVLLGERPPPLPSPTSLFAKSSTLESALNTIAFLRPHWPCFGFYPSSTDIWPFPSKSAFLFTPPAFDIPTADIEQAKLLHPCVPPTDECKKMRETFVGVVGDCHLKHCHPEDNSLEEPARVTDVVTALKKRGAFAGCEVFTVDSRGSPAVLDIHEEDLFLVHSKEYLTQLKALSERSLVKADFESDDGVIDAKLPDKWRADSVFIRPGSFLAAKSAAATAVECVRRVVKCVRTGDASHASGLAVVRPPGHHAGPARPAGFCLLNNVALAAKVARKRLGVKRVLIVDVDVHLGDGTLECLRADREEEGILFVSLHRFDDGTFYPGEAFFEEKKKTAEEANERHVLIPWNGGAMGDAEYCAALYKIVLPVATSFNPELVLFSAGMDCLKGDPLGGYLLNPSTLALYISHLSALAPTVAVLEGGYDMTALTNGLAAVLEAMRSGHHPNDSAPQGLRICEDAWQTLRISHHSSSAKFPLLTGFDCPLPYPK